MITSSHNSNLKRDTRFESSNSARLFNEVRNTVFKHVAKRPTHFKLCELESADESYIKLLRN